MKTLQNHLPVNMRFLAILWSEALGGTIFNLPQENSLLSDNKEGNPMWVERPYRT
jgi:hypothetical protein